MQWNGVMNWYADYTDNSQYNPKEPDNGTQKILRGGDWFSMYYFCDVGHLSMSIPSTSDEQLDL